MEYGRHEGGNLVNLFSELTVFPAPTFPAAYPSIEPISGHDVNVQNTFADETSSAECTQYSVRGRGLEEPGAGEPSHEPARFLRKQ